MDWVRVGAVAAAAALVVLATWGFLVFWVSFQGLLENSEPATAGELAVAGSAVLLALTALVLAALRRYAAAGVFAACAGLAYLLAAPTV